MKHTDSAGARAASKSFLFVCLFTCLGLQPAAATVPNDLCTGDPCIISSDENVTPGSVLDFGTRAVILQKTLDIQNLPSGDVGSITIKAGSFQAVGDGQIKGTGGANLAGSATIETTGDIALNGTRSTGTVRLTGTDGGNLTLKSTAGAVTATGIINLDHEGIPAYGGILSIDAAGAVTLSGEIIADGGSQGGGGVVLVVAGGNIDISGAMELSAGEGGGGEIDFTAGGSLTIGDVTMDGGGDTGDAGFATLVAGGSITFAGIFRGRGADSGENCGDGADVDIDAIGDLFFNAEMDVRARALDCTGGSIAAFSNSTFINSPVRASGDGSEGDGGSLDIDSTNQISVPGTIELDGGEGGGDLSLFAGGNLSIQGFVDVRGRVSIASGALFIELDSGATMTISGSIIADGGATGDGGDVLLSACDLVVPPSGSISCLGTVGAIEMVANDSVELHGTFSVSPTGLTDVTYGPAASPPNTSGATFVGPSNFALDPLLLPCPSCVTNLDCSDGDTCTSDVCGPDSNCSNPLNPSACVDGNPCTDDVCSASVCSFPPNNDPCSDGSLCTEGDACSGGGCVAGPPADCVDDDTCTIDSCIPASGCQNDPIPGCTDTDGDGKVDTIDECTTIEWTASPIDPPDQNPLKLRLALKKLAGAPGQRSLLLKGLFNPASTSALPIDPSVNGVHIYIADDTGANFDVSIPGGLVGSGCGPKDGWKVTGQPTQRVWKYRNLTGALPPGCAGGSAQGLVSAFIKDLRNAPKAAMQFKVKVKAAQFDHSPTVPLTRIQAVLALGAQPSPGMASQQAIEGQCAEALYTGNPIPSTKPKPFCKPKEIGSTLNAVSCKGE